MEIEQVRTVFEIIKKLLRGTSQDTGSSSEFIARIQTNCFLLVKYDLNQSYTIRWTS